MSDNRLCYSDGYDETRIAEYSWESNDCTVVALMNVTGFTYAECHKIAKDGGRPDKQGAFMNNVISSLAKSHNNFSFHRIAYYMENGLKRRCTLAQLMNNERFKKGTYIVTNCDHAFVLKNGIVYDNHIKLHSRRRIVQVYQIFNEKD